MKNHYNGQPSLVSRGLDSGVYSGWVSDCLPVPVGSGAVAEGEEEQGPLMKTEEAASFLQIHPRTVRLMVQRGQLPYLLLGTRILRFLKSDLIKFGRERQVS